MSTKTKTTRTRKGGRATTTEETAPAPAAHQEQEQEQAQAGTATAPGAGEQDQGEDTPVIPINITVLGSGQIDPRELVIDQTKNGRRFEHTAAAIQARAKSMLENGQQQPIRVHKVEGGKLEVVFGYLRALAGCFINEHELAGEGLVWLVRYELVDIDQADILAANAVENLHRELLNDADLLHLITQSNKAGIHQKTLAARLNLSPALISRVAQLKNLNAREIKLVSLGKIPSEHARELAGMESSKRKGFVDAMSKGEDITVAQIKAGQAPKRQTKRKKAAGGDEDRKTRTAKEMGLPFEAVANHQVDGEDMDVVQKWCGDFGKFSAGGLKPGTLIGKLYVLAGMEAPSWLRSLNQADAG